MSSLIPYCGLETRVRALAFVVRGHYLCQQHLFLKVSFGALCLEPSEPSGRQRERKDVWEEGYQTEKDLQEDCLFAG